MTTTAPGLIVALDGPGSSGKSSVGAAAALELGYRFCDTGLLYRAATWLALERHVRTEGDRADPAALVALVPEIELVADANGRLAHVSVGGIDVTDDVHTARVDDAVSAVSRVPELRAALLERQRSLAAEPGGIIMAGRDIGTVVLPDADLKIFLDASVEERARRRTQERDIAPDSAEARFVLAQLRRRDDLDSSRAVAPLRPAEDAIHIVTDGNRFQDTVAAVVARIREAEAARSVGAGEARPMSAPPADRPSADRPSAKPVLTDEQLFRSDVSPLIGGIALGSRFISRCLTRVGIEGDSGAIPREGPVILAANHISNADAVLIGAFITPRLGRRIHWLGKKEMFDWPVLGYLFRNGGIIPVDRGAADVEAFRVAQRILDAGNVLMVFPEGTRSPTGELQVPKDGLAMLALRTNATIVPIGISNTDRIWPKGRAFPLPGKHATMRIGKPFRAGDLLPPEIDRKSAKGLATTLIMRRIAALLDLRHRGTYGEGT